MQDRTAYRFGDPRLPLRFWEKAEVDEAGCWVWVAAKTAAGYGTFTVENKTYRSHRVAYQVLAGVIPDGLVTDHLCRVRACVNPAHLDVVTHQVNLLRGETRAAEQVRRTQCPKGHAFDEANTRYQGRKRRCRTCENHRTKMAKRLAKEARSLASA